MQKMVKFKLSRECREIAVNPARVLYVCHYEHGATSVHFGKECFVRVKGDLDEVTRQLEAALGEEADEVPADAHALRHKQPTAPAN